MARIVLIETHPYEAVWGGDAVYLDRIRACLTERGHEVETLITDISRGRSNPIVTLRSHAGPRHRWSVRRTLRLGEGRYCSLDPHLVGKALRRLNGGRATHEYDVPEGEAEWALGRLRDDPPALAILAFGACSFAGQIRAGGTHVLALQGFFSNRRLRLGEETPAPLVSPAQLRSLSDATLAGFNNRHDLDLYAELSGRDNGVLVGMGFPKRTQPVATGDPHFLFVAAWSKPNVESLDWLIREVWPRLHALVPEAGLRIAGSVGRDHASQSIPGVRWLGFVDDLAAEYRAASAAVAPLVSGSSGVKTKIPEALSFGRPVVTTSLGVDPSEIELYRNAVLLADDPDAFAAAMARIATRPDDQAALCSLASDQFDEHFTTDAAYRDIIRLIEARGADDLLAAAQ